MRSLDDIEISLGLSFLKAGIIFNGELSCWNINKYIYNTIVILGQDFQMQVYGYPVSRLVTIF